MRGLNCFIKVTSDIVDWIQPRKFAKDISNRTNVNNVSGVTTTLFNYIPKCFK